MKKFIDSMGYALNGIKLLFAGQNNIKIQVVIGMLVCLLGWIINLSSLEWIIVLFCIGWVISAESFNTAIEYVVDFISPDYHIKAGQIKDISAGGVLIISITSSIIGIIIFLPKCIKLLLVN
jgi:diacylglycerol kinase (ATP)